jgi:UDP-glucose 4-epimerase
VHALVTGCAGFIGSHLTDSLLADGHTVVGVDCFNDNYQRPPKIRNLDHQARDWDAFDFVPVDLSRGGVDDLLEACDVVFHLAAEPGVRSSWGSRFERYLQNNVVATQHLLEAVQRFPGKRFVFASSSSIYGDAEQLPTPESTIPGPVSPYGMTKLAAEHLCHAYSVNHAVDVAILRYFTVYGPRQRPDMALHRFCEAALNGSTIEIYGDGTQTRDFTYVGDIVAGTRAAAVKKTTPGAVFNLGGGSRTSLREVLEIIGELSGGDIQVRYTGTEHGDVRDTAADISRAAAELGYSPRMTLRDGLAAQLDWHRGLILAA